jgi:hypothetical protein
MGTGFLPRKPIVRARLFEGKLRLLPDSLAVHQEWRKLLVVSNVSGVQEHDARLVAAMRVYGVGRILTFNERTSLVTQISKPLILEPFQQSIHEHLANVNLEYDRSKKQ